MPLIRRISFRLSLVALAMISIDIIMLSANSIYINRTAFVDALIATSLIFAITAGLILAIINNYVKGVREQFIEQARRVRHLAWDCYENYAAIDQPDFQDLFSSNILPLAKTSLSEWSNIENIQNWGKNVDEQLVRCLKLENHPPRFNTFLYRYLLPLEDEINLLGRLYIRRAATELHARTATGVFYLLAFAVAIIAIGKIMPSATIIDWVIVNCAIAVITYSVLELILVLSYLLQEVREESVREEAFIDMPEKKEPSDNNNREKSNDKEAPQQGATPDRVKPAPGEL